MKKLINSPADVVTDSLLGLASTRRQVSLLDGWSTVVRTDYEALRARGEVALISGGGSGHEPAHAGYVGSGMLTAAVCGEVFTSPSVDAVLAAIRLVGGPQGVLLIVKNYTGDRLNFGLAAELAAAEGIPIEMVVVADDVSMPDSGKVGRRGIAGTVLIHKLAGAAARRGWSLNEVADTARKAASNLVTMGVGLTACTVPAAGVPSFTLEADELEWGLGIHGERGVARGPVEPVGDIVDRIVGTLTSEAQFSDGSPIALLVNGLGATPPVELDIVAGAAMESARRRNVTVERIWVGNFLTALDMAGFSLSAIEVDDDRLALLDSPVDVSAWPTEIRSIPAAPQYVRPRIVSEVSEVGVANTVAEIAAGTELIAALSEAARSLIVVEDLLTEMDRKVGDGDLGISLARGAQAILAEAPHYPSTAGTADVLRAASGTVRRTVGGTSGPLYAVMLLRAASALERSPGREGWADAFTAASDGVREIGGAKPGDCTMVDALAPAAEAFAAAYEEGHSATVALERAAYAANEGTTRTKELRASLGRASYVGDTAVGEVDPGAHAVTVWLSAVLSWQHNAGRVTAVS